MFKFIPGSLRQYSNLPKSIYVLFLSNIINKMGNFVVPFLTLYLTHNLKFSADKVGFLIMIASGFYLPGSLLGGKLVDKYGRKSILLISQSLSALFFIPCIIYPYSPSSAYFIYGNVFFTAMADPAYVSMTTDLSHKNNRNEVFSLLYIGSNIGTAIGPLLAGYLFNKYVRWLFIGNIISILLSIHLIYRFVPETIGNISNLELDDNNINTEEKAEEKGFLKAFFNRPTLIIFAIVSIIFSFTHAQSLFALPLQVTDTFGVEGSKLFGYVIATNAIVVVTLTSFLTNRTKNLNPIINVALGGVFYFLGFGMLYYIKTPLLFILSSILWTSGEILVFTNQSVYIVSKTPITHRGRFNSVMPLITGIGRAFGPAIMGKFIAITEIKAAWLLIMVLISIASMTMYTLYLFEKGKASAKIS